MYLPQKSHACWLELLFEEILGNQTKGAPPERKADYDSTACSMASAAIMPTMR